MKKKSSAILILLSCLQPLMALENAPAVEKVECVQISPVQANRMGLRQIEGKGIGYSCGYTTVETFLTPFSNFNQYLLFGDLRAHRLDNRKFASNAGIGIRYFSNTDCYIWGVNSYYDYRQTRRVIYKQIALGLEALGAKWDFRLNGYLPFGRHKSFRFHVDDRKYTRDYDMRGLDAEAAYHWTPSEDLDITAAAGPYHLHGSSQRNAVGGKVRVRAKYSSFISLEGIVSYDNIFKCNVQGQLAFYIPLGPKLKDKGIVSSNCSSYPALEQRLVQPVERSEIIPVDRHRHHF